MWRKKRPKMRYFAFFFFLKILSFVFPNKKSKMKFPLILEFPVKKFRDQVDFLFVDKHQFPTS